MTIKKKDGSNYKLNGPNPIVSTQEIWDMSQLIVHNLSWKPVKLLKAENVPVKQDEEIIDATDFIDAIQEPEKKIVEPVIFKPAEKPVETTTIKNKITVWCYQAITTDHGNSLYGESYKKRTFGEKILLEAVIVNQSDFLIQIWTNVGTIPIGSILYPQTNEKRWWAVADITEYKGGFIYQGTISDITPAFDS